MTAPLYDIKAKFSEYVTRAENGDVVEITKYGTTTAVIISKKDYDKLKTDAAEHSRANFVDKVLKWRAAFNDEISDDFALMLEKNKGSEIFRAEENPWE